MKAKEFIEKFCEREDTNQVNLMVRDVDVNSDEPIRWHVHRDEEVPKVALGYDFVVSGEEKIGDKDGKMGDMELTEISEGVYSLGYYEPHMPLARIINKEG